MGRPSIGKQPMTAAERQRRRRAKLRDTKAVTKPKPGDEWLRGDQDVTWLLRKLEISAEKLARAERDAEEWKAAYERFIARTAHRGGAIAMCKSMHRRIKAALHPDSQRGDATAAAEVFRAFTGLHWIEIPEPAPPPKGWPTTPAEWAAKRKHPKGG